MKKLSLKSRSKKRSLKSRSKKQKITRRMKGGVPCTGLNWTDATSGVLYNIVKNDKDINVVKEWLNDRKECKNYNTIIVKFIPKFLDGDGKYIYNSSPRLYLDLVKLLILKLTERDLNQERVVFYIKRQAFEKANPFNEDDWAADYITELEQLNKEENEFKNTHELNIYSTYADRELTIGSNPMPARNL